MSAQLEFVDPILGMTDLVDFGLTEVEGAERLYSLRSSESPGLRLYVLDGATLPDYAPELSDDQVARLELTSPSDAAVYVVINPAPAAMTVNLLAPIVVNVKTSKAAQFILDDARWGISVPLADVA
ncbi:flagellar assembly protein FliW [Diaminobutyricibacter sp. McL0608]|uniref:flagellar assembly protein FliW n=1 Tax=Leifsonia sp. McL0608 TaxID=3143537 RepID=UPI0031F3109B